MDRPAYVSWSLFRIKGQSQQDGHHISSFTNLRSKGLRTGHVDQEGTSVEPSHSFVSDLCERWAPV